MFYYFFLQYKNEIYLANRNKFKLKEIAMIVLFIVSAFVLSVLVMLQIYNAITLISLLALIADITHLFIYVKRRERERISEKVQKYKETKVNPLIGLLKSDTYNLHSLEGINWLIECCAAETNKTAFRISVQGIILPFITLAYGVILNGLNPTEVVMISITFVCILLMVVMLGKSFQPIVDNITYPDKVKYYQLKEELEYIKTQF